MTFTLDNAQVYDVETYPNVFTFSAEALNSDAKSVWEISEYRDDRFELFQFFAWLHVTQTPMIGFFSLLFDYPVIHYIYSNPRCSVAQIYAKSQEIMRNTQRNDRSHLVYVDQRFAPQIDLFKIHHFDNKAKTTSLKALEINMRSRRVIDLPIPPGSTVGHNEVGGILIPYNQYDVDRTKQFAHFSKDAIDFRIGLLDQFGLEVLNYNDTKIGEEILIKRLGDDICFDRSSGRKIKRQTIRTRIALNDIIFPYVQFTNSEFNRVLTYLKNQVLLPPDIEEFEKELKPGEQTVETKGVFKGLSANVGGIEFKFGTGGIHGSVANQKIVATDEWLIRDIDVASLYPSIAIVNHLSPAHLGEPYVREYSNLPKERKEWQAKKGKKCVEANSLKLAGNGVYGKTNSKFSVFFDTQYTMTVTINGQLMLCMLAEWLMAVPTFQIIQINTDGITYRIHRDHEPRAVEICKQWEKFTLLTLESANYRRMWIRDVNNYVAEDMDGKLKQKGAYWHPDPQRYAESISEAQPSAWYKDLGNSVSVQAAVQAMTRGFDPETFIRLHTDPFDFMCRIKVDRASQLLYGGSEIQRTTRYYVAKRGAALIKKSPPSGPLGEYKRRNGISDREFNLIASKLAPGVWDERIHTKNKGRYEWRETAIEAGWNVAICNDADDFRFDNVDYNWYVIEAKKLII